MLELTLRVGAGEAEEVLDAVLPTLPGGAHVREAGEAVVLTIAATPGTPDEKELRRLVGSRLIDLTAAEASDDWRERRLARYEPLIVAERFLLRPDWAPPGEDPEPDRDRRSSRAPPSAPGCTRRPRPASRRMAEARAGRLLRRLSAAGSGVLSIAAAQARLVAGRRGRHRRRPASACARRNAERNGVEIDVRRRRRRPPSRRPARRRSSPTSRPPSSSPSPSASDATPALLIASGFKPDEIPAVASAWERARAERRRRGPRQRVVRAGDAMSGPGSEVAAGQSRTEVPRTGGGRLAGDGDLGRPRGRARAPGRC